MSKMSNHAIDVMNKEKEHMTDKAPKKRMPGKLDATLKQAFKACCAIDNSSMESTLEVMVLNYVKHNYPRVKEERHGKTESTPKSGT